VIEPNPDWETISIFVPAGTMLIDDIIIDTRSFNVPEPSTASLLAVAFLAVATKKARRRT
jgi:hypothetical protein